jgi:tellurium resistance protein TerD
MIHIPMNVSGAVNKQTVLTINRQPGQILQQSKPEIPTKPIPALKNPVQKGQKIPLENGRSLSSVQARLGWNVTNPSCDVDVSAFLLNQTGKVIGDDWFVFYGQETSPDQSTTFSLDDGTDREIISIDFNRLDPAVSKIVFVLTINEALEKRLNFSMLKDAYIRITDTVTGTELVSFRMDEYYANVTSMMIGEVYRHNGNWKFNAIGNGVARDLAGLCELYGVQVV